jgi:hypothetical protein
VQFEFFRLRFHFKAIDPLIFGEGKSANTLRGAFGTILREVACTPECSAATHHGACAYARIFEPRGFPANGPSGFAERPRPFVFRTHHLDGRAILPGERFYFGIHLFDLNHPAAPHFVEALGRLATEGLGPRRGRAKLTSVDQLATDDRVIARAWDGNKATAVLEPTAVVLTADGAPANAARVRFVTPTELKCGNALAERPEFPVLFARIRDRLSALRAFYGPGPLDIDFRAMGGRASRIEMTHCELRAEHSQRRSSRTGQVHPLGGFTGEAEYRGDLTEFLPYLRVARWTGVGRQTVWGKGEIELVE